MYYRLNNRRKDSEKYLNKKTVMLIEDNKFMLSLLSNLLRDDFTVRSFTCADEANNWINNGNEVDVIISDINLDQSNGIDFARNCKTKDKLKNVPFIFLTGMDESDLTYDSMELKYDAYINKPFNPDTLIDQIKAVA